jgi:hypothetical protein
MNSTGKANGDWLKWINPFPKYLLRYYYIISSSFCDILYSGLNFSIILGSSSILKSYLSWYGGNWSTNRFLNLLIILWYSSGIKSRGLIYCFNFSTFLMSSIVTIKILWSHFFINEIKSTAYIIRISKGFVIIFLYSLLWLTGVALLY